MRFSGYGWVAVVATLVNSSSLKAGSTEEHEVQGVIDKVEKECRERSVFMIGRKKAERLGELVRRARPRLVVECGTAIGYSGLWIGRELKAAGRGKLITLEIDAKRAEEATRHFRQAGLQDVIEVESGTRASSSRRSRARSISCSSTVAFRTTVRVSRGWKTDCVRARSSWPTMWESAPRA